jgi:hypothetical protein
VAKAGPPFLKAAKALNSTRIQNNNNQWFKSNRKPLIAAIIQFSRKTLT